MSDEISTPTEEKAARGRWITGAALILIGLLILADRLFELPSFGTLFLPGLGLIFLLWGIYTRNSGLLVPGGILSGIGAGVYLQDVLNLRGDGDAGIFLLAFGGGFVLITVLSLIFTNDKHWWALIPGGIMAAIGAALFIGGVALDALELAGTYWPVLLIVAGVYVIFKRR